MLHLYSLICVLLVRSEQKCTDNVLTPLNFLSLLIQDVHVGRRFSASLKNKQIEDYEIKVEILREKSRNTTRIKSKYYEDKVEILRG